MSGTSIAGSTIRHNHRRSIEIATTYGRSPATSSRGAPVNIWFEGEDPPLRYISWFCGIGGFDLAFNQAGFECAAACEISDFPRRVFAARFGTMPLFEDIENVRPEDVPQADIWVGGFPCFPPGTFITTTEGEKKIEDVTTSDRVLTHEGRFRRVLSAGSRPYDGDLVAIQATGLMEVRATPNHPFYARASGRTWNNERRAYDRTPAPPAWIDAASVGRGAFVRVPAPTFHSDARRLDRAQNGLGVSDGPAYTVDTTGAQGVAYGIASDAIDRSGEGAAGNTAERSGLGIVTNQSPTLKGRANAVATRSLVHRLIPKEAERLQGFPDGWTDIPGASDAQRYRALGNAVAVPCVAWIARRLAAALRRES